MPGNPNPSPGNPGAAGEAIIDLGGGWNPLTWFNNITNDVSGQVNKWLGGIGGDIASGIEGGFIATIKDLIYPIEGALLIIIGGIILIFTLIIYFREPLGQLAGMALKAAA